MGFLHDTQIKAILKNEEMTEFKARVVQMVYRDFVPSEKCIMKLEHLIDYTKKNHSGLHADIFEGRSLKQSQGIAEALANSIENQGLFGKTEFAIVERYVNVVFYHLQPKSYKVEKFKALNHSVPTHLVLLIGAPMSFGRRSDGKGHASETDTLTAIKTLKKRINGLKALAAVHIGGDNYDLRKSGFTSEVVILSARLYDEESFVDFDDIKGATRYDCFPKPDLETDTTRRWSTTARFAEMVEEGLEAFENGQLPAILLDFPAQSPIDIQGLAAILKKTRLPGWLKVGIVDPAINSNCSKKWQLGEGVCHFCDRIVFYTVAELKAFNPQNSKLRSVYKNLGLRPAASTSSKELHPKFPQSWLAYKKQFTSLGNSDSQPGTFLPLLEPYDLGTVPAGKAGSPVASTSTSTA